MNLWLIRHARPLIEPGICYGQLDIAADTADTLNCAQILAAALPEKLQVSCSPLQRCEQMSTALLALRPDLTCKTDPRLSEMHFGCWEGRPWASIAQAELQAWTDDFANYRAGSGADGATVSGETVSEFMRRVAGAFDELPHDSDTLWITHAGVIRAASLLVGGVRQLDEASQWPAAGPAYGQWCKLQLLPGNTHGNQP